MSGFTVRILALAGAGTLAVSGALQAQTAAPRLPNPAPGASVPAAAPSTAPKPQPAASPAPVNPPPAVPVAKPATPPPVETVQRPVPAKPAAAPPARAKAATPPPQVITSNSQAPAKPKPVALKPVAPLAPPIGAPVIPGNNVRCAFDNLSIEDREMTLMMIGLDYQDRGRYTRKPPKNEVVDRLINEALAKCASLYHWSPAASAAAFDYAQTTLVLDVVRQAIEYEERDVGAIDAYYAAHRSQLAGKPELDDLVEESFASHLKEQGWRESERAVRRMARVYLESLIARDASEMAFAKAMPKTGTKGSKRRAGKAKRGRP